MVRRHLFNAPCADERGQRGVRFAGDARFTHTGGSCCARAGSARAHAATASITALKIRVDSIIGSFCILGAEHSMLVCLECLAIRPVIDRLRTP